MVTREQTLALGLTGPVLTRLNHDRWRRIAPGVYFTADVDPPWDALAWGGVLAGGDQARLGPHASAWLHRLTSVPPMPIDVLVPHQRGGTSSGPWRFVRERAGVRSPRSVGTPPRLPIADTVIDVTAVSHDEGELIALLATAAQRRLTTPQRLLETLESRHRHPHRALLRAALGDIGLGAESLLEVRYLRDVERAHGLPRGRRQRRLVPGGQRTDVAHDEYALVVELDGRIFHDGVARFRDLYRDNVATLTGKLTLRYGWYDTAHRPCRIAAQVAVWLAQRGWSGLPTRCPRCRHLSDSEWERSWREVA